MAQEALRVTPETSLEEIAQRITQAQAAGLLPVIRFNKPGYVPTGLPPGMRKEQRTAGGEQTRARLAASVAEHPGWTGLQHAAEIGISPTRAYRLIRDLGLRLRGMKGTAAAATLAAMLREQPNLCMHRTLADIGAELGVTGERVRQLLPKPPAHRHALRHQEKLRRVAAFVEAHPECVLPLRYGGIPHTDIAAALGVRIETVYKLFGELGYPSRRVMTKAAEWGLHARTNAYRKRQLAEQLGTRVCAICGTEFPWTRQKEGNWRAGQVSGETCGISCGRKLGLQRRRKDAVATQGT